MREHFSLQPLPSGCGCQLIIILVENHPFACDGVGWFSCFLISSSERNRRLSHAQSPSELHEEIQEMFPWLSPPFLNGKKHNNQPPSQYSVAISVYHIHTI